MYGFFTVQSLKQHYSTENEMVHNSNDAQIYPEL